MWCKFVYDFEYIREALLTAAVYEHEYVYAYVNKQKIEFLQATCVGSFEGIASFAAVAPCQLVLKFA